MRVNPRLTFEEANKTLSRHLTPEFLECLEYVFPNPVPRPGQTLDEIMFMSGQASVVTNLKLLLDEAQENILENH